VLIEVGILSILPQDAHVTLSYLPKMAKVQSKKVAYNTIHGSGDAIVGGAEVQALGGEGHIRVEVLADAGHFPMTEASARFSALLREFLFKERA